MRDSKLSASGGVAIFDGICVKRGCSREIWASERAHEARPGRTGSQTGVDLVDDHFKSFNQSTKKTSYVTLNLLKLFWTFVYHLHNIDKIWSIESYHRSK